MRRFFAADSLWNTPLAGDAEVDPRSGHFLELLDQKPGGPFWINLHKYTIPVYEVDAQTPRVDVAQRMVDAARMKNPNNRWGKWSDRKIWWRRGPGFGRNVPIPAEAAADPAGDAHLAMVDWASGTAWDMWAAHKRDDGTWESNVGMVYDVNGSGVWQTSDFPDIKDGDSVHFHGPSRAAGVPAIAGLIMLEEVLAGRIEHKLAFATAHNALKEFVAPATWTDGFTPGGLPEGAVIQIDPKLKAEDFGLSAAGAVVFRALQEYGAVNVDVAGGNTFYGQLLATDPQRTWRGVLEENELYKVPLECYRVLKLGDVTRRGDSPREIRW